KNAIRGKKLPNSCCKVRQVIDVGKHIVCRDYGRCAVALANFLCLRLVEIYGQSLNSSRGRRLRDRPGRINTQNAVSALLEESPKIPVVTSDIHNQGVLRSTNYVHHLPGIPAKVLHQAKGDGCSVFVVPVEQVRGNYVRKLRVATGVAKK